MEFQSDDKGVSVVTVSNAGNVNLFVEEQTVFDMFSELVSSVRQFHYDGCVTLIYESIRDALRPGPGFDEMPAAMRDQLNRLLASPSFVADVTTASGVFDLNRWNEQAAVNRLTPHNTFGLSSPWLVPVRSTRHFYGCFIVYHRWERMLTSSDVRILTLIAERVATTLDFQRANSSYQMYESLFRDHPLAVLRLDATDVVRDVNRAFQQLYGRSKHQLVGLPFDSVLMAVGLDSADVSHAVSSLKVISTQGSESEDYVDFLRHNLWISIPILIDGATHGRYVVFNDVSRILKMHEKLRTTQDLLTSFVYHSTDPIVILEPSGVVTTVNPAFEEVFGWEAEEVSNLFVGDLAGIDLGRLRLSAAHGVKETVTSYEAVATTRDGRPIDVDVTLSSIQGDGQMRSGLVAVVRDVSDRKRAERKLRMSQERYHSLVHHHPNAILAVDLAGRIVEANQASERILGYALDKLLELNHVKTLFSDDTHHLIEDWLRQYAAGESLQNEPQAEFETTMRHARGHTISVAVTWVPIIITDHGVEGAFLILEDMTERKRAEEIFRYSDKLSGVGQLAAGIAHEIRNPLTAIQGFCRLLEEGATPTQARYLKIMKDELARVDLIVGEMMALAKPADAFFRIYAVQDIVRDVVALMNAEALLHGVELHVQCDRVPARLHCDPNQLKQVLVNIIKNALEATNEGGQVSLVVAEREDVVEISVEDTGEGIPEEHLEQLGTPFFTTKERGTGLGLLVSRRIVQAHGGSLQIDSVLGQGTTVLVRLPKADEKTSS
ncbi:PAS domain-containing sensor histidine kinase [Alicyclobacillus suci]|uniref:PAS domain-containing sensor histidine kinase n=1 Tax=Alicyclobacillus suci TaxID=2816080 RepID=UPI001A8FB4F1|nr:PAS domain-containing sensor histidine kinase [Alicyclobacillus suci]